VSSILKSGAYLDSDDDPGQDIIRALASYKSFGEDPEFLELLGISDERHWDPTIRDRAFEMHQRKTHGRLAARARHDPQAYWASLYRQAMQGSFDDM